MKFKKGDRVKIPARKSKGDGYGLFIKEIKPSWKYLIITSVDGTTNIGVEGPNGEIIQHNSFLEEELELYEVKYKFKVGDVLEVIESGSGCVQQCIGEKCTVVRLGMYVENPGYEVEGLKHDNNSGPLGINKIYDRMIKEDSFKLAEIPALLIFN